MEASATQVVGSLLHLDEVAAPVYNQVRQELFAAEETTQNSVETPTEASRNVDQSVDVPLDAAPARADDAPVPASAFQVGDSGYDVFRCRHCEIIRLACGIDRHLIRVVYSDEDRFCLDVKLLCLDVGQHDFVDGVRDGNRPERYKNPGPIVEHGALAVLHYPSFGFGFAASRSILTRSSDPSFYVPATYMAIRSVLSLCASRRTTGFVRGSGDGMSHSVTSYDEKVVRWHDHVPRDC